eukprot:2623722-Pleurochrysis_carterae.AAC.3
MSGPLRSCIIGSLLRCTCRTWLRDCVGILHGIARARVRRVCGVRSALAPAFLLREPVHACRRGSARARAYIRT